MVRTNLQSPAETVDMNVLRCLRRGILLLMPVMLLSYTAVHGAITPPVQLWQIARDVPNADPRWQQTEPDKALVRLWRGGQEIRVRRLMELLPGDELQTGANAGVVVRYRNVGDVVILERTRVKIGSLEVFFGRVFASLRGKFTVSSETVVAGVEGTRFL